MKNNLFLIAGVAGIISTSCNQSTSTIQHADLIAAGSFQLSATNSFNRGEEKRYEIMEMAMDNSMPDVQRRAKQVLEASKAIEKSTVDGMELISKLKTELFQSLGEDVSTGANSVIAEKFKLSNGPLPGSYRLHLVKSTASTDLIGFGSQNGKNIVEYFKKHRKAICEIIASSNTYNDQHFSFNDPAIDDFKDANDLYLKLNQAMGSSPVSPDDQEAIKMIYVSLTYSTEGWQNLLPESCNWLTAFNVLTTLENQLLKARADAFSLIRSRVGGSPYSFNQIIPIVQGPDVVKSGEQFDLEVSMAAVNSDNQPRVLVNGGGALTEIRDGKGIVRGKGMGSEMVIAGNITILDKSGMPKTMPWKKKITVLK